MTDMEGVSAAALGVGGRRRRVSAPDLC